MVNQTQKKTTASSISEKSGITHLPNSQDEDETMPTTVDMVTAFLLETDRTMIDLRGKKERRREINPEGHPLITLRVTLMVTLESP